MKVKRIAIFGSTGSIGRSSLRVIDALGSGYEIVALSGHSNVKLLAEQARKYRPQYVAVTNGECVNGLEGLVGDLGVQILVGPDALTEIAELDEVDVVLSAIVGAAGLPALLAAAEKGKMLAIANKEPLVIAGELLTGTTRENGGLILPVDSEHSAIFQAMQAGSHEEVRKVILTASGGPFRTATMEEIRDVTLEQALSHPTWKMGPKITIDSATMANKAFEVIETRWLFDIPMEKIDVLVHPESIVHSLVEFVDGSVVAQLGLPDMCLPIQYALTYPERVEGIAERLRLEEIGRLTFEEPDLEKFRALAVGFEVGRIGGSAPVVFNAANEVAVEEFLAGRIKFVTIVELIEHCVNKHDVHSRVSLEEIYEADAWARREVIECLKQKAF